MISQYQNLKKIKNYEKSIRFFIPYFNGLERLFPG
jgi:hypothetical protein